jgi:hypothetical protein
MGRLILGLGILALLAGGCGSSGTKQTATSASELAPVQGKYDPSVDPADFVAGVDNPPWPLKPGTAFHYVGTRGGHCATSADPPCVRASADDSNGKTLFDDSNSC